MPKAYISVGSNTNPRLNVRKSLELLASRTRLTAVSTVYLTKAEMRPEQPSYYNCVIEIDTAQTPKELKVHLLRKIEKRLGRRRSQDKFASRPIDLDLIFYEGDQAKTRGLDLPDPEILSRPYLARPLQELRPNLKLHRFGMTIAEINAAISGKKMKPLARYTTSLRKSLLNHIVSQRH